MQLYDQTILDTFQNVLVSNANDCNNNSLYLYKGNSNFEIFFSYYLENLTCLSHSLAYVKHGQHKQIKIF